MDLLARIAQVIVPMVPLMLFALGVRLTQLRRRDVPRGLLGAVSRPLVGLAVGVGWRR
jgi:hypothetical protein